MLHVFQWSLQKKNFHTKWNLNLQTRIKNVFIITCQKHLKLEFARRIKKCILYHKKTFHRKVSKHFYFSNECYKPFNSSYDVDAEPSLCTDFEYDTSVFTNTITTEVRQPTAGDWIHQFFSWFKRLSYYFWINFLKILKLYFFKSLNCGLSSRVSSQL